MNINSIETCVKTIIKSADNSGTTKDIKDIAKAVTKPCIEQAKPQEEFFCHKVWKNVLEGERRGKKHEVDDHGKLNALNSMFVSPHCGMLPMKKLSMLENKSFNDIIESADFDFKCLKPIDKDITVYRGIANKPEFFKLPHAMFEKSYNAKAGDKIIMKEYAYSATDKDYATHYTGGEKSIMYEIEVPKGSKVSLTCTTESALNHEAGNECVFPRNSQFEVLDKQIDKNGVARIKIKYIQPDESWLG